MLIFLFLSCLITHVPAAEAQGLADISGTVMDSTGGAIPSATVTAQNVETGAERSTTTDAMGAYRLLVLPVGMYQLHVTKAGFNEAIRDGIHLSVGQRASVDFVLQIGNVEQQIRVTAEAPPVSTTTSDISGLVAEQQVKELPLN